MQKLLKFLQNLEITNKRSLEFFPEVSTERKDYLELKGH